MSKKFHIEKNYISNPLKLDDIYLLQIGRTHFTKDYIVEKHIHRNWFELTHVIEGKGKIITNEQAVEVNVGDIYLSFPGDMHAIYADGQNTLKYNFISFWTENDELYKIFDKIMFLYANPQKRKFTSKEIEHLIENSISEIMLNDTHSLQILKHILNQLIFHIAREFEGEKKTGRLTVGTEQELCYQIMNYINTNIYTIESLACLSDYFGYNYSYLSDMFSKTTKDTLKNYYLSRRLDTAAMLIAENNLSISQIAELLKYSSIYTFSRAFKNRYSVSPTEYKKQLKI